MQFSKLLEQLMIMNDVRQFELAEYLGYDRSYISRWVSGKRLPSLSLDPKVLKRVSAFFEMKIIEESNQSAIEKLFNITLDKDVDLMTVIYYQLSTAYRMSKMMDIHPKKGEYIDREQNVMLMYIGKESICENALDYLHKLFTVSTKEMVLYVNFSIDCMESYFRGLEPFFYLMKDERISLNISINIEFQTSQALKNQFEMLAMLMLFPNINLNLYHSYYKQIVLCVGNDLLMRFDDVQSDDPSMLYTENHRIIAFYKNRLKTSFEKTLLSSLERLSADQYEKLLKPSSTIYFITSFLQGLFMEDQNPLLSISDVVKRNISLVYMVERDSFLEFLDTGKIQTCERWITVAPEQRLEYVFRVLKVLRYSKNIELYIFKSRELPISEVSNKLSYLYNDEIAVVKRDFITSVNGKVPYSVIESKQHIHLVESLYGIVNQDINKKVEIDVIEYLIHEYETHPEQFKETFVATLKSF